MESGVVSLVIVNCLTVSAESLLYLWSFVTAYKALVHQNVHFL